MTNEGYLKIGSSYLKIGDLFLRIGSAGDVIIEEIVVDTDQFGYNTDEDIEWQASDFSRNETDGIVLIALYQRVNSVDPGEFVVEPVLSSDELENITLVATIEDDLVASLELETRPHHRLSLWQATIPTIVDGSYSFNFFIGLFDQPQSFSSSKMIMIYGATSIVQSATEHKNQSQGGTSISVALSSFADSDNIALAFCHVGNAATTPSPDDPLEQLGTTAQLQVGYLIGEDTEPSFTLASESFGALLLACEIAR